MTEAINYIPNRVRNAAVGGHVCGSVDIIDDDLGLEQNAINKEVAGAIPYDQANPNGMGRVVLKKNDNFKQVVEAQTNGNTIFVIKYDFTLTDNVTIPANCVLEFDGGSISGTYTLEGNDTLLKGNPLILSSIFGTFANSYLNITWFGAVGDDNTDNTLIVNKVLSICVASKSDMYIPSGTFASKTSRPIIKGTIPYDPDRDVKDIDNYYDFNNITIFGDGYKSILKGYSYDDIINLYCCKNLFIKNIAVTSGIRGYQAYQSGQNLMSIVNGQNIHVDSCLFKDSYWQYEQNPYGYFDGGSGISCQGEVFNNIIITNCDIENCSKGIDLYAGNDEGTFNELDDSYYSATNIRIKKCFTGVWAATFPHKSVSSYKIDSGLINIQARCTDCTQVFKTTTLLGANVDIQAISTQTISELFLSGYGTSWFDSRWTYSTVSEEYGTAYIGSLYCLSNCNINIYANYKELNIGYHFIGRTTIGSYTLLCENNYYNLNLNSAVNIEKRIGSVEITNEAKLVVDKGSATRPFKWSVIILNGLMDNNKTESDNLREISDLFYYGGGNIYSSLILIIDGKLQSLYCQFYEISLRAPGGNTFNKLLQNNGCICGINEVSSDGKYLTLGSSDPNGNITVAFSGNGDLAKSNITNTNVKGGAGISVRNTASPFSVNGYIEIAPDKTIGTTSQRPSSLTSDNVGFCYFDTTLNKPIYWTGSAWVDATGASV